MPAVHVLIKTNPNPGQEGRLVLEMVGPYRALKSINARATQLNVGDCTLLKPFLCSNAALKVECNRNITFDNYSATTDVLLVGFAADITEIGHVAIPANTQQLVVDPGLDFEAPVPEFLPASAGLPAKMAAINTKHSFTADECEKFLNVIKANMKITISGKSVVLLLQNQTSFDEGAVDRFENMASFIRRQMRKCGYEFQQIDVAIHVSPADKSLQTKMVLTQEGDLDDIVEKLDPRLAMKIRTSRLKTLEPIKLTFA